MTKYEQLKKLALEFHEALAKLDIEAFIEADNVHVKLPVGFWYGSISSAKINDGFCEYNIVEGQPVFKICGITFHNNRSLPDWMKKINGT